MPTVNNAVSISLRSTGEGSTAPAVRLADRYLAEAVARHASDLHFDPAGDGLRIRVRVDGLLRALAPPPAALVPALLTRLRLMAGVDLAGRQLPQEGSFSLYASSDTPVDVRASFVPAHKGEKIVFRLLSRTRTAMGLGELGLETEQMRALERAIAAASGLILAVGPTGSGKSTTLFAALARVTSPDRSIVTVEDPVELEVQGATQIGVDDAVGRDFATILRALLRQDPDVILIGEMRDTESARIACRAALTGHLVLSTLHTTDSREAVTRLADMGVPKHLIVATVRLVIAQRLLRRLCPSCRAVRDVGVGERSLYRSLGLPEPAQLADPAGCEHCEGEGFAGRLAVFEFLDLHSKPVRVDAHGPAASRSLLASGLRAAARFQTDCSEVLARCPEAG